MILSGSDRSRIRVIRFLQEWITMKVGILGLPQTGKKTLFALLTGSKTHAGVQENGKILDGIAEIRDNRFDDLASRYAPAKATRARISLQLFPRFEVGVFSEGAFIQDLGKLDVICYIARGFIDVAVYHALGSVNPERDIRNFNMELVLQDLLFIEKRLERIRSGKKPDGDARREEEMLLHFKAHLESGLPLRTLAIDRDEIRMLSGYPLLSLKKMIVVLNIDEAGLRNRELYVNIKKIFEDEGCAVMQISVKLESEIALLDSTEEIQEFMREAGIEEPALETLSRLCMEYLGLISFFTVGSDEVRQWLVRKGSMAPEAGGAIHTDIQRGFIRSEVMKFPDIVEYQSEEGIKKAGRYYVMGKNYEVEDGDIMSFRFNV